MMRKKSVLGTLFFFMHISLEQCGKGGEESFFFGGRTVQYAFFKLIVFSRESTWQRKKTAETL